jgi:glucose dehydrogenase
VDLKTGRVMKNEAMKPATGKTLHGVCPVADGGKDWQPSAFSPKTGLLYIPHNNMCMDYEYIPANYIAGTPYLGVAAQFTAGPGGNRGAFTAWDPVAGKPVWEIKERFPAWSGAMVTAGDIVFYGTMDRWFKAVDAKSGNVLWQFQTGSGIISQPTTFLGPDGKQYVAVIDGVGGWAGAIVAGGLDPADGTGALGFVNAMKDLPNYTGRGGTVYVFSLP